jgi:hypothetical protein
MDYVIIVPEFGATLTIPSKPYRIPPISCVTESESCDGLVALVIEHRFYASPSSERLNNLNKIIDLVVELLQFARRDPILLMDRRANGSNWIFSNKLRPDTKTQNVSSPSRRLVIHVPVSCNLRRVILVVYWIEKRLFRQARRKPLEAGRLNQLVFAPTDRAV